MALVDGSAGVYGTRAPSRGVASCAPVCPCFRLCSICSSTTPERAFHLPWLFVWCTLRGSLFGGIGIASPPPPPHTHTPFPLPWTHVTSSCSCWKPIVCLIGRVCGHTGLGARTVVAKVKYGDVDPNSVPKVQGDRGFICATDVGAYARSPSCRLHECMLLRDWLGLRHPTSPPSPSPSPGSFVLGHALDYHSCILPNALSLGQGPSFALGPPFVFPKRLFPWSGSPHPWVRI
jgi:hypothetical protein